MIEAPVKGDTANRFTSVSCVADPDLTLGNTTANHDIGKVLPQDASSSFSCQCHRHGISYLCLTECV